MKTMNKTIIAVAVAMTLTAATGTAFTKGNMGNQADPATKMSYIFTQLSLTEAQQADVLAVMEAAQAEQRAVMLDTRKAMRESDDRPTAEEMQAMREAHQTAQMQVLTDKLNTVLSPDVTADLVEYLAAHQGKGPANMHDRKGDDRNMGDNRGQGKNENRGQGKGESRGQGQGRGQAAPATN